MAMRADARALDLRLQERRHQRRDGQAFRIGFDHRSEREKKRTDLNYSGLRISGLPSQKARALSSVYIVHAVTGLRANTAEKKGGLQCRGPDGSRAASARFAVDAPHRVQGLR